MANDNVELGRFDLVGIPAAPRGIPQIEVAFDIDANGIVHVSAKDHGTGKEQSIRITAPKKLSKEEIEKMVKDAEQFAETDKKKKEEIEVRNQADQLVYATDKSLKDFGDKVSAKDKTNIEKKAETLKEALKGIDLEVIKKAQEELTQASHKLAEEVYKQQAAQQQAAGAGEAGAAGAQGTQAEQPQEDAGATKKPEDVVDAEYEVEEEKK